MQPGWQGAVNLQVGDRHLEWDRDEHRPKAAIRRSCFRLVVCRQPSLVRREIEKHVLSHVFGRDEIALGDALARCFAELPAFLGLSCRDESRPVQRSDPGELSRVELIAVAHEHIRARLLGVVPEQRLHDGNKCTFPVAPRAKEQEQHMLADLPGERVSGGPLHKRDDVLVAVEDSMQERKPPRALGPGGKRHRRELGDELAPVVREQPAGAEVDRAVFDVER